MKVYLEFTLTCRNVFLGPDESLVKSIRGPYIQKKCGKNDGKIVFIDRERIVFELKEAVRVTNDAKVKEFAEQITELSEKIDGVETELKKVEALIENMCNTFGHDTIMPFCSDGDVTCSCCEKKFTFDRLMECYMEAPLHGTVNFDYAKFGYEKPKVIEYRNPFEKPFWD